jgi:hypothetical protein
MRREMTMDEHKTLRAAFWTRGLREYVAERGGALAVAEGSILLG